MLPFEFGIAAVEFCPALRKLKPETLAKSQI
jgi:hypothetical protein